MRFWPVCLIGVVGLTALLPAASPVGHDLRLLKQAAERGVVEAQYLVGLQYQDGQGVKRNTVEAARWLRQAATAGHAEAQYALGELLCGENPEHKAGDPAEAEKWFSAAAAQGHAGARARLGAGSSPLPEDPAETMRWRLLLSGLGGAEAWVVRGFLLENGIYVNRDPAAAAASYRQAATLGQATAQYRLGLLYARGTGVEPDLVEACAWLGLAVAGGHPAAKAELAELGPTLTADQAAAAAQRTTQLAATVKKP
jgi:uncharacterized protein